MWICIQLCRFEIHTESAWMLVTMANVIWSLNNGIRSLFSFDDFCLFLKCSYSRMRCAIYDLQSHFIESYLCMRHALSSCWNELMAMTAMPPHSETLSTKIKHNTNQIHILLLDFAGFCAHLLMGKAKIKNYRNALFSHFYPTKWKKIARKFSDNCFV